MRILTWRTAALALAVLAPLSTLSAQSRYHGYSIYSHLGRVIALKSAGYRVLSLDVAGDKNNQSYSAVWVKRSGPAFEVGSGRTKTQLLADIIREAKRGYRLQKITSAGYGGNEIYASVFVKDNVQSYFYLDVSKSYFESKCQWALKNNYILTSASVHGYSSDPRYCIVLEPNTAKVNWGYMHGETSSSYQTKFSAYTGQWARPYLVSVSSTQYYLAAFRDDRVSGWVARHNMTAAGYQTEYNTWAKAGYYPLSVSAGGFGSWTRYAAVFVKSETPYSKLWRVTGTAVSSMQAIDNKMKSHMQGNNIRAGQIAVAKDGRLIFARGYTWADSTYPVTQPTTSFRFASCAKPIATIAAFRLWEQGKLKMTNGRLNESMHSILGIKTAKSPYTPRDSRYSKITVEHLLNYASGMIRNTPGHLSVANYLGKSLPVNEWDVARYVAGTDLVFYPGTDATYSNNGYEHVGLVIARRSGMSYMSYLKRYIFQPLGLTRARLGYARYALRQSGEARCHAQGLPIRESDHTASRPWLPAVYSGRGVETIPASGGLIMSAADYVRILAGVYQLGENSPVLSKDTIPQTYKAGQFGFSGFAWRGWNQQKSGKGVVGYGKGGSLSGVKSSVLHRADGLAIAVIHNGPSLGYSTLNSLLDNISSWPSHDLFPSVGLPAFKAIVPNIQKVPVGKIENVGTKAFVLQGTALTSASRVYLGRNVITNKNASDHTKAWFKAQGKDTVVVHPAPGMAPGKYSLRISNGTYTSNSVTVEIVKNSQPYMLASPVIKAGQVSTIYASKGSMSDQTVFFVNLSFSNKPSTIPGLVRLGIGNNFTSYLLYPQYFTANATSGALVLPIKTDAALRGGRVYAQISLGDPLQRPRLPLRTTNVVYTDFQ